MTKGQLLKWIDWAIDDLILHELPLEYCYVVPDLEEWRNVVEVIRDRVFDVQFKED